MERDELMAIVKKGCPKCGGALQFSQDRNVQERQPTTYVELHISILEPTKGIRERLHCDCGYENVVRDDREPPRELSVFDRLAVLHGED